MSWPYGEIDMLRAALAQAEAERDELAVALNAERLKDGSLYRAVIERAEKAERNLAVLRSAIQGERQHTDEAEDRARVLEGALDEIKHRSRNHWHSDVAVREIDEIATKAKALSATPAALLAVERAREEVEKAICAWLSDESRDGIERRYNNLTDAITALDAARKAAGVGGTTP